MKFEKGLKHSISVLVVVMFLFGLNSISVFAGNSLQDKIQAERGKFPDNAYWNNHNGVNNPNGYTWQPCTHHVPGNNNGHGSKNGSCGCNSFDEGIQCLGFSAKIGYDIFGGYPNSEWIRYSNSSSVDNVKIGDIIRFQNDGHSIFVIGVSGNTVYTGECWGNRYCKIKWDYSYSKSEIKATFNYLLHAPNYDQVAGSGESASPNDYPFPTRDLYYTNPTIRGNDVKWVQAALNVLGYSTPIDGSYGPALKECVRKFQSDYGLTADGSCGPATRTKMKQAVEDKLNPKPKDTTPPTITNAKVTNITSKGYTVTCTAKDASGINRVQFPTWTQKNGQDDLEGNWENSSKVKGSKSGSIYTFQVKISDHKNESGKYNTHIYAYDTYGNRAMVQLNDITVPAPKPSAVKVKSLSLDKSTCNILVGKSTKLTAKISPSNATNKGVTWKSSNTKVATISSNGTVKVKAKGSAVISCTTKDGSKITKKCTIYAKPKATSVKAAAKSSQQIKISWNKVSGANGYAVYFASAKSGKYTRLETIKSGSIVSYLRKGFSANKNYYFKVKAYFKIGDKYIYGDSSLAVSCRTKNATTVNSSDVSHYYVGKLEKRRTTNIYGYVSDIYILVLEEPFNLKYNGKIYLVKELQVVPQSTSEASKLSKTYANKKVKISGTILSGDTGWYARDFAIWKINKIAFVKE